MQAIRAPPADGAFVHAWADQAQKLQEQLGEQLAQKQQSLAAAAADEKAQEQAGRHVAVC